MPPARVDRQWRRGPLRVGRRHFTKELARDPKNVHALTARGVVMRSCKDADKAVADHDRAIGLDPKATLANYHRANLAYGKAA